MQTGLWRDRDCSRNLLIDRQLPNLNDRLLLHQRGRLRMAVLLLWFVGSGCDIYGCESLISKCMQADNQIPLIMYGKNWRRRGAAKYYQFLVERGF
jgi:hypothetical protein